MNDANNITNSHNNNTKINDDNKVWLGIPIWCIGLYNGFCSQ